MKQKSHKSKKFHSISREMIQLRSENIKLNSFNPSSSIGVILSFDQCSQSNHVTVELKFNQIDHCVIDLSSDKDIHKPHSTERHHQESINSTRLSFSQFPFLEMMISHEYLR